MSRGRWVVATLGAVLVLGAGLGPVVWELSHPASTDRPLTGYDDARLVRHSGEDTLAYVERATLGVGDAVEHSDENSPDQTWEVALLRTLTGGEFAEHEDIIDPRWLRRGLCSQQAAVLAEAMRRNGVKSADAYQIDGHVVVEFEHDGATYVTDPDIGVGPYRVDWADPDGLAATAQAVYADAPPPYDVEWATPILADTSGDAGEYPREYLEPIAAMQERALSGIAGARWVVVGLGAALVILPFSLRRI